MRTFMRGYQEVFTAAGGGPEPKHTFRRGGRDQFTSQLGDSCLEQTQVVARRLVLLRACHFGLDGRDALKDAHFAQCVRTMNQNDDELGEHPQSLQTT